MFQPSLLSKRPKEIVHHCFKPLSFGVVSYIIEVVKLQSFFEFLFVFYLEKGNSSVLEAALRPSIKYLRQCLGDITIQ